jgi:hypothetical protein
MTGLFPDDCWADPLTRKERRELARRLTDYARRFSAATARYRAGSDSRNELYAVSNEMGDLHLDVTERATVAAS